jgi:hypothetical protein
MLKRYGLWNAFGEGQFFYSVHSAVQAFQEGKDVLEGNRGTVDIIENDHTGVYGYEFYISLFILSRKAFFILIAG